MVASAIGHLLHDVLRDLSALARPSARPAAGTSNVTCICIVLTPVSFSTLSTHPGLADSARCVPERVLLLTWWLSLGGSNGWPAALSFVCPDTGPRAEVVRGQLSRRDE